MALTPAEEQELAELESLAVGKPSGQPSGLTPKEESELAYLEKLAGNKPTQQASPENRGMSLGGFLSNVGKGLGETVSGIKQLVGHPIETGKNIADYQLSKTELPEYLEDKPTLAGLYGAGASVGKTSGDVVKGMAHSITHPYEDPVGFGLTASPVLRGLGSLAQKTSSLTKVGSGLMKAGAYTDPFNLAGKGIQLASKPIGWMAKKGIGATTGQGAANIEQWMKGSKDFFDTLHGRVGERKVVENVKQGLKDIKDTASTEYKQTFKTLNMSEKIGFDDLDRAISNIEKDFRFTEGVPTLNPSEMGDYKKILKIIEKTQKNPIGDTALGLDSLKQQIDYFYTENSRIAKVVGDIRNTINKSISSKVPGYTKMNYKYSNIKNLTEEMESALIGSGNPDTVLKKLQQTMREEPEIRRNLLDQMNNLNRPDIQAQIAGLSGRSTLASGLVGRSVEFGSLIGTLTGYLNPKMIALVFMSSPRVMAETLGAIGLTKQQIIPLLNARRGVTPQIVRNGLILYGKQMGKELSSSTTSQQPITQQND